MSNWLIFLYPYFGGIVEMLIQYYFFNRFLEKKILPIHYVLFTFVGIIIIPLYQADNIIKFIIYIILFMLIGILIGRANIWLSLLYSIIILEVMYLCYGISNSLLFIFGNLVLKLISQSASYVFMGIGGVLSLTLSVFCYMIIEKYFTNDEKDDSKYALIILAPTFLIF